MIKVGIIGATGYAGAELVRILMNHKEVEIKWYGSRSYVEQEYADVFQNMFQIVDDKCMDDNMDALAAQVDVIFTATPQGYLAGILTEDILSKVKIIDLSADYRIKDVSIYEKWYKIEHKSPQFIEEAVYGLCEINRGKVCKDTRLIANPGCYTTCSILTAYPLVKEGLIDPNTLIVDAKSGTSGAGRGAKTPNLFCEVNENIKAYGVASHRHTPEIEEQLGYAASEDITISFTPHLVPMMRGILATEYASLNKKADGTYPTYEEVKAVYDKYMNVYRTYIINNKQELLDKLNNLIFNIEWNKYALGNYSAWEMEALCFYYHEHELAHVDTARYGFSNFSEIPENPIVEKTFTRGNKEINMFKLFKICGTCIAKNKTKSTVSILTTDGVVNVKFRKEYFALFDKQISERGSDGVKHVVEKSWFNRGSMIVVMGIRSGDDFISKKYASSGGHQLYKIDAINEDGSLTLRDARYQGDAEDSE